MVYTAWVWYVYNMFDLTKLPALCNIYDYFQKLNAKTQKYLEMEQLYMTSLPVDVEQPIHVILDIAYLVT